MGEKLKGKEKIEDLVLIRDNVVLGSLFTMLQKNGADTSKIEFLKTARPTEQHSHPGESKSTARNTRTTLLSITTIRPGDIQTSLELLEMSCDRR